MTIADNISRIRAEIAEAATASGRRPGDVVLLAATKTQPVNRISEAIEAGIDVCGENKVQEMLLKWDAYAGRPPHFIGRLQRNKCRQIVGKVPLIHSVDSLPLAQEIHRCAKAFGIVQDVLLEVNIGQEPTKGGFIPDAGALPLNEIMQLSGIRVRGLMCIPPPSVSNEESLKFFSGMKHFFVDITSKFCDNTINGNAASQFDILSMGMSDDYALAVRCGSTLVRVGSAIFGSRF